MTGLAELLGWFEMALRLQATLRTKEPCAALPAE